MASDDERRNLLARLLVERSLQAGEFELASGKEASVYVDVKKTSLSGRGAAAIGDALWELADSVAPEADAVGGLTLGADPLVTAMSISAWSGGRDLAAIIVRKEAKGHGTRQYLERPDSVTDGAEVVAVDDVITTGGSTLEAISRMREAGLTVRHAVCVVDREDVGTQRLAAEGVQMHSLFTLSELLEFSGQD